MFWFSKKNIKEGRKEATEKKTKKPRTKNMNSRASVAVAVVVAAMCACVARAMCDQWGVRKCGIEFANCTANSTGPSPQNVTCECYRSLGSCLGKFDCYSEGPYYLFHYTCISYENGTCGEKICGDAAASLSLPLVAAALAVAVHLLL